MNKKLVEIPVLNFAFLGDAVHTLLVRDYVFSEKIHSANNLHKMCTGYCCAKSQSLALDIISSELTEDEQNIIRRTRNAKNHACPKNSNVEEYKKATCLEALFGYLHLDNQKERIKALFKKIMEKL